MYSFGPSAGDATLDACDDCFSTPLTLPASVLFYGTPYSTVFVSGACGTRRLPDAVSSPPRRGALHEADSRVDARCDE